MKIAICGTRGIPACYGGFETFAEQLATRLVERGHDVVVYGRKHVIDWDQPFYKGVKIRLLGAPRHKYLETPVHALASYVELLRNKVDVVLSCNAANSPFLWVLNLGGMPVAVNLRWDRAPPDEMECNRETLVSARRVHFCPFCLGDWWLMPR